MRQNRTSIHAARVASTLLESDLTFFTVLDKDTRGDSLSIYAGNSSQDVWEVHGTLSVNWFVEIEARSWGVKDINVGITYLVLDGWIEECDEQGDMQDRGRKFHYEYPEKPESPEAIGPDMDAPSKANIDRLSNPKWKVTWKRYSESDSAILLRSADVDLNKHTIDIEF